MFTEHYRKNNIFISSLSKISKTKNFFSNLLLKIGGRKNEKNRKEKVFCFGYGGAIAESLVR
jgi:hypothetical protein